MHVTVAAATGLDRMDLSHETALVEAALLYADEVTLAAAVEEILGATPAGADVVANYRELRKRVPRLSPPERLLLRQLEAAFLQVGQAIGQSGAEMLDEAGAHELTQAAEAGLLQVHAMGADVTQQESFVDVAAERMAEVLAEAVSEHATTFPLFDDDAGTLVRAMIDEGKLASPYSARANEAGIAGRLIGDLEAFPDAEMDVILDVRESLKDPPVRFRSALAEASTEFASASWEQDFGREVDDLYRRRVAPALLEVREGLEELGAKQTLLRLAARKDTAVAAAATLAVAATAALGHVELPEVIYGLATPAVIAAAASEARERGAAHRVGEANAFYFLYQAARELRAS